MAKNFGIREASSGVVYNTKTEQPVLILEDVSSEITINNDKEFNLNIDVDEDCAKEIIETLT